MSKNLKLKKIRKCFVPEPKKNVVGVSCFSDSYMRKNILCLWTLGILYACEYLGRILDVDVLTPTEAVFLRHKKNKKKNSEWNLNYFSW